LTFGKKLNFEITATKVSKVGKWGPDDSLIIRNLLIHPSIGTGGQNTKDYCSFATPRQDDDNRTFAQCPAAATNSFDIPHSI
jgi:hypothetical protein